MMKVLVALPEDVVSLIDSELKGRFGDERSTTVRGIILSWHSEHGYVAKGAKRA